MRNETKEKYPKNWAEISQKIRTLIPICEICGKTPCDGITLTAHHRDYNPANNNPENLLVCCQGCHFAIQVDEGKAGKILPIETHRGTLHLQPSLF